MELLEREAELGVLADCLDAARRGESRLVLVAGEAGIGKTALIERFCSQVRGARVLRGACDPLVTPRPLGPVLDMSERLREAHPDTAGTSDAARLALFREFLDELSSPSWVTVAVIEDAHWADEATRDLIRFAGRRLREVRAVLAVTYRDDELGPEHPLRTAIGDLATASGVVRIHLPPLTRSSVAALAESSGEGSRSIDIKRLHRQTAGNPFFVTEVLAAGAAALPATVRDAVLARAARLPPAARSVADAAAVAPTRIEAWLALALAGAEDADLDGCVASGILRPDAPGTVAFRHELARQAMDAALLPARRAALHRKAAALLLERHGQAADSSRIAHHAEQAGDGELAREHALRAAARAAVMGAHREAADSYERALRYADSLPPDDLAQLLERYSQEATATDRTAAALEAADRALPLRRSLGEPLALGGSLTQYATALWQAGRSADAAAACREAVRVLEALEPGPQLADALAQMATYSMLARDHPGTLDWGRRAVTLAERVDSPRALARALNSVGSSKMINGDASGLQDLQRCIEIGSSNGIDAMVAIGWSNLGSGSGEVRDYRTAEPALRDAIAFATARDIDTNAHYSTAWLARVRFELGDWAQAESLASALPLYSSDLSPVTRIVALTVLGRLHARRGDPDPLALLDEAWQLAAATGDLQRLWPAAAGRAETMWLAGDRSAIPGLAAEVFALARELDHGWATGELGLWLWRAGDEEAAEALASLAGAGEPYALHVAGEVRAAAAAWEQIGCPYEAADALADSGDPDDLRRAVDIFDQLEAGAAARRARRRLRARGQRAIPRGPRPATTAHPAGLTARQAEVLDLLAQGLSDAEIAQRLYISTKTAGHHVSAILAKLGAASRGEAVHLAHAQGLVLPRNGEPGRPS